MSSSKGGISGVSWFWGIVLSLFLHAVILLLAIFWGFGTPKYLGEPESIEGRLVSLSELEQPGGGEVSRKEEIKPSQPERKEIPEELKKEEPKKVEVKKEEPPEVKEEKPKEKDTVVLETKKQTKKEEKKQVAEKPKPTEPPKIKPPKETEKKKENFEDVRNKVIAEMQKKVVLGDIQKSVEEKKVASRDSSGEEKGIEKNSGYSTGQSASGSTGILAELFVRRVREEIRSNWRIPENIPIDGSLKTVIVFRLDERGKVYDVELEKSSGNSQFDDFCVKAIYRASPLTPPPPELLEEAKTEGLEITFTNE